MRVCGEQPRYLRIRRSSALREMATSLQHVGDRGTFAGVFPQESDGGGRFGIGNREDIGRLPCGDADRFDQLLSRCRRGSPAINSSQKLCGLVADPVGVWNDTRKGRTAQLAYRVIVVDSHHGNLFRDGQVEVMTRVDHLVATVVIARHDAHGFWQ